MRLLVVGSSTHGALEFGLCIFQTVNSKVGFAKFDPGCRRSWLDFNSLSISGERVVRVVQRQLNAPDTLKDDRSLLSVGCTFTPAATWKTARLFKDVQCLCRSTCPQQRFCDIDSKKARVR